MSLPGLSMGNGASESDGGGKEKTSVVLVLCSETEHQKLRVSLVPGSS